MSYFQNVSPFKKRYIPIFSIMTIIFILDIILIFTFPIIAHEILVAPDQKSSKSGWPTRLSAPYIDMSSWVDATSAYSINGAPDLGKLSDESGFMYFNLGDLNNL